MSDSDRDIDLESAEKRAHHNALERKRRDHIKDSFTSLRESVPSLQGEKVAERKEDHNLRERMRRDQLKNKFVSLRESVPDVQGDTGASRAQILKKAADYIQFMRRKNSAHQQDIDDLKRQNSMLESQIRTLEKAKATGNFAVESGELHVEGNSYHDSNSSASDSEEEAVPRQKKIKTKKF